MDGGLRLHGQVDFGIAPERGFAVCAGGEHQGEGEGAPVHRGVLGGCGWGGLYKIGGSLKMCLQVWLRAGHADAFQAALGFQAAFCGDWGGRWGGH